MISSNDRNYRWYTPLSQGFLEKDYLMPGQSLDERVEVICQAAERLLEKPGFAARFKENVQKGWYSFSTPIWTNFGTTRGLPISCFGSFVPDSMEGILGTLAEVGMMTKHGGGTSAYFGALRPRGAGIKDNGESCGAVHFMQLYDGLINTVSQGMTRRGNFAAYLPIDHADILEFLTIRSEGAPIQDLSFGICVPDDWMQAMVAGDPARRKIWAKVLECRSNVGFPYLLFTGNANRGAPFVYQDQGIEVTHSNLCSEIMLPDGPEESFVCDLSSMNILYFEEWRETDAVELLVTFLDAVMTEFIEKAEKIPFMERAANFGRRHRALGVGWIGWHSFLQSKGIAFESLAAKSWNAQIAQRIQMSAQLATQALAREYGEPAVCQGYGRRNATLLAIAPTKSSAFILGQVSEGIEPHRANVMIKDLAKGKFTIKNPYLEALLETKGKNTPAIWTQILKAGGSVQQLGCLTEPEKNVFKTFAEISPMEIILQAAQRQPYIDQGQSLNLMIHPSTPIKDVNQLIIKAWELGIKSLYYQISVNAAQELGNILQCASCEG